MNRNLLKTVTHLSCDISHPHYYTHSKIYKNIEKNGNKKYSKFGLLLFLDYVGFKKNRIFYQIKIDTSLKHIVALVTKNGKYQIVTHVNQLFL